MPDVRMPDGTIMRNVPAGATKEQIWDRYQRARQAGAVKDTRPNSGWGAHAQGVLSEAGKGAFNALEMGNPILSTLGQLGLPNPVNYARDALKYQERKSPYQGSTAGKIAGGVIATAPLMFAPGGGLRAALAGGAGGGAMLSENIHDPKTLVRDATIGAAGGAIGHGLGKVIARPFAKRGASAVVSSAPKVLPGRATAVRQARFARAGVQAPTVGQITRDPRVWKFEREALKRTGGDPVLQAMQGVDRDLVRSTRSLVDSQGGAIGPEAMGQRVIESLDARNAQLNKEVSSLYNGVRQASGDARIPSLENFRAAMAHPDWADNMQFDDMAASINKRLARYADADGGQAGLNVKQAEEMRKFIGNLGPNDRQTFAMRRVFQDALDTDVLDNMGGQPFAQARAAAKARFDEFSKTYAGKLAGEGIAPERVGNSLRNAGTSLDDLRSMVTSLKQSPNGDKALASLRSQYLDDVLSKGITADGKVNGTTMANEFAKNAPRLRAVMEPEAYKQARRIAMAARDATADVPYSNVNHANTASTLADMIAPIAKQGLFGRVANSPLGRAAAHTLASPAGPAGHAGVEATVAASNFAAQRAGDKALERQIAMTLNPQLAAQELAKAQEEELMKRLIAQKVSGRIAGPFGGLGVAGSGLVFGNSQ